MVAKPILDINNNGKLDAEDIELTKTVRELEKGESKNTNQALLAWFAMIGISIVTFILFTPLITNERIKSLEEILNLYYITQASIVGIYMGVNAYMNKNGSSSSSSFTTRNYYPDYQKYESTPRNLEHDMKIGS